MKLEIENILEINTQAITPEDWKKLDYTELLKFLKLLSQEDKTEILARTNRTTWWTIQRNLNGKHPQENQIIWVWVCHYLKLSIQRLQTEITPEPEITTITAAKAAEILN